MQARDPFNPRYEKCGFRPEEVVGRRVDLTSGQKLLYGRMVRWARRAAGDKSNERAGEVWWAHETMAGELGKSTRQIARDIARLEAIGLLTHRQRDGRKSNTYIFLWHPDFDQSEVTRCEATTAACQIEKDPTGRPLLTRHERQPKADLTGHQRHPNQEELSQKVESHTLQNCGRLSDREQPTARGVVRASQARATVSNMTVDPADRCRDMWQAGGWASSADFETWWSHLVWEHPNRHRNSAAKELATRMLREGKLRRDDFDEGYHRLKATSLSRWSAENGRYAPNLLRLLEDSMWKYTPVETPAVGGYENANDYLRRIENE